LYILKGRDESFVNRITAERQLHIKRSYLG
jgi:hypothetical protein